MANEDYTLVRLDSNITDGAVLTYDAARDLITDSGMTGSQGELRANAGTVSVGLQDMSSAGEQVVWRNSDSHVIYAPPWHIVDEVNTEGSRDRVYGPLQTQTRFADRSYELENPSFQVHIPVNEVVFRLDMTFPIAQNNVEFKITHAGHEMWREVKDVSAGKQEIKLDIPIAFYAGDFQFSIQPYGDNRLETPIRVMGNPVTGEVGYDVTFRPFREIPLATQEWTVAQIVGGPADEVMFKKDYDTNKDGIVDNAHMINGVQVAGNDKYYGTDEHGAVGFHSLPSGIDVTTLQNQVNANKQLATSAKSVADANKAEIDKHETAINGHGTQLAAHANQISTNTNNIKTALATGKAALQESQQVRNMMVEGITADLNHAAKTITLHLTSKSGNVDSVLIDLSPWFTGGNQPQPGVTHKLYYGFSQNPPMQEDEILRLSTGTKTVDKLAGTEITLTRVDSTPKYMYVWIPDGAGTVKGFTFSNFLSTWQSTAVNVAGIDGKFFVSPNKTSAKSVTFEVTV